MENFEFVGKVVKFPSRIKPSVSIVMLENNNVSKEKLHYIISKQTNDSLVLLKYNENAQIKLTEFVTTLITYYKRNQQLKSAFDKIVVEGNDSFSIIKNIICPPSSAGIGRKFTIAKSIDMTAINNNPEKIPPVSITSPPTFVIAIIPCKSFKGICPVRICPKPYKSI